MNFKTALIVTAVATSFLISGCVSKPVPQKNSGFFKDYNELAQENKKFTHRHAQIMPDADFSQYENVYVAPIQVVSSIPKEQETDEQKKLYKEISDYLTRAYKKEVKANGIYTLVEDKTVAKTLVFEAAMSAVEVHFDDTTWYQFMPIELGLTAVARNTYMDGSVRVLGEGRLVDAKTGKLLLRTMNLQKAQEVSTQDEFLIFTDVQPALDAWLKNSIKNLVELRKGIKKYEEK